MSEWKSINDSRPADGEKVTIKFKAVAIWGEIEATFDENHSSFIAGPDRLMLSPYWNHDLLWKHVHNHSASTE